MTGRLHNKLYQNWCTHLYYSSVYGDIFKTLHILFYTDYKTFCTLHNNHLRELNANMLVYLVFLLMFYA